ncbi:hypothetical protein FDN13_01320 [Caloramator sp. E03]|uniref:hypothetical protein n=1 Tax=Caloramator sp. E03 TaxID=2576307 RepID=UPI001110506B|nr:hypothetical protein [Caloramator sp. E03]QCX32444.1 hypothetical protein FDN13_01320 [Caloramator sp. E03]
MGTAPNGYNTPKTNWAAGNVPAASDFNRIEGNIYAVEEGSRTIDQAQTPSSNQGNLRQFLDWFANRIKAITGKTNWYDAPSKTLEDLNNHINAASPHTGHATTIDLNTHATNNTHIFYAVCDGSANNYTVTVSGITSYTEGIAVSVKINVDNTGASTINVNGIGVKSIKTADGDDVVSGDLKAGSIYTLRYNGTNFILQGKGGGLKGLVPIYYSATAPTTSVIGAIWVEMSTTPARQALISQDIPADWTIQDDDMWLRILAGQTYIDNLELDIIAKNIAQAKFNINKGSNNLWQMYSDKNISIKLPYPNNVLHRESGVWKAKNAYYWDGTQWVKFFNGYNYLYNSGVEYVPFETGYTAGIGGTVTKNSDNINVYTPTADISATITAVTSQAINITGAKKIWIDWVNTGSGLSVNSSFGLITTKTTDCYTFGIAKINKSGAFTRVTESLDVSSLSGNYFVAVEARKGGTSNSNIKLYSIWLEY